jgi:hypothetical protein
MGVGTVATQATMAVVGDLYANEPVYIGAGGAGGVGRPLARDGERLRPITAAGQSPRSRPMTSFMISVAPP